MMWMMCDAIWNESACQFSEEKQDNARNCMEAAVFSFLTGSKLGFYTCLKDILIPNCSDTKTLHQPRYKQAHLTELCGHPTQRYIESNFHPI